MKSLTKLTIFLGDILSLIPYAYLQNNAGILITIFCFGLILILCELTFEDKVYEKGEKRIKDKNG